MEKRYQVFVSSTYEDLREERQEVMHALLELDCIPNGMELFPAASEDQWTVIKHVIDDCDYYVVIIGGRYGSVDQNGMSYTEKEYRYALEQGKPVIGFLHKNPEELPAKKYESSTESRQKLKIFRDLVQQKLCQSWEGSADLGSKVSRSLIKLIKQHPAIGWVRANELPSEDVNQELLMLRKKVEELEKELATTRTNAPKGTESLAQGDERYSVHFTFKKHDNDYDYKAELHKAKAFFSWNEIFYVLSPHMINEASNIELTKAFNLYVETKTIANLQNEFRRKILTNFSIEPDNFQTVLIQLRALGLIVKSERTRSLKDQNTYWRLTPYGDTVMTRLRAIQKANDNKAE